jgi:hypothetical protein
MLDTVTDAPAEPLTAAYLARRGVSAQWRAFLRAMVETLDQHLDAEGRAALMRVIGRRMADAMPLAHCDTLAELESQINEALAAVEWGYCAISLDTGSKRLVVTHSAAPAIAAGQDLEGRWIAGVLEGLYGSWFANQPGADGDLLPEVTGYAAGRVRLEYGRG